MVQVRKYGLIAANKRRLMCLSMFWHFLDLIWIGVFTVVYLMECSNERRCGPPRPRSRGSRSRVSRPRACHTEGGGHGSVKSYLTGFVLSVILTVIRSGW